MGALYVVRDTIYDEIWKDVERGGNRDGVKAASFWTAKDEPGSDEVHEMGEEIPWGSSCGRNGNICLSSGFR